MDSYLNLDGRTEFNLEDKEQNQSSFLEEPDGHRRKAERTSQSPPILWQGRHVAKRKN